MPNLSVHLFSAWILMDILFQVILSEEEYVYTMQKC